MQKKMFALEIGVTVMVLFVFLSSRGYATPCKSIPDSPLKNSAFCSDSASKKVNGPMNVSNAVSDSRGRSSAVSADPIQASTRFTALPGPVGRRYLSSKNPPTGPEESVRATPTQYSQGSLQSKIAGLQGRPRIHPPEFGTGSIRPASFFKTPSGTATGSSGTDLTAAGYSDPESDTNNGAAVVNIPENGTLILLGAGLIGIAGIRRRQEIKVSDKK